MTIKGTEDEIRPHNFESVLELEHEDGFVDEPVVLMFPPPPNFTHSCKGG